MRTRFRHYLKPNFRSESPRHILAFDTETEPDCQPDGTIRHALRFGWSCYLRQNGPGSWRSPVWKRFTTPLEFWSQIDERVQPKTTLYVFCHNTNFDLPVVQCFAQLKKLGWTLTRAVIDGPPTIVVFKEGTRKLVLLDTLNWWRVPLAELGKSVGFRKLPMPPPEASAARWDRYCRRDVEVLCRALRRWLDMLVTEDLGGFASTLAGQAMRTWRHKFMPAQVLIDTDARALPLARAAYLGGRCEIFRQGVIKGKVHGIDINSMYPAVMRGRLFPTQLIGFDDTSPERTFCRYRASSATVGKVLLHTQEPIYPRLIEDRLCFPVGTFWAALAGPELSYAVDHGHVLKFESVAVYQQRELFTDFVDYFYKARMSARAAGDTLLVFFFKILMNSLYGKFGQRGRIWEEAKQTFDLSPRAWVEYDVTTGITHRYRQLAGLIQEKREDSEAFESMPAIAAYVTSYARMELYRLIQLAGWNNVIYCDTDSLFLNDAGLEGVKDRLDSKQLGMAKHEWTSRKVHIRGLKDYSIGKKSKTKGVRKNATWLTDSELVQDGWSGLKGQLRAEDIDNAYTRPVRKHLSRRYTKGTIGQGGKVSPLVLNET